MSVAAGLRHSLVVTGRFAPDAVFKMIQSHFTKVNCAFRLGLCLPVGDRSF